MLWGGLRGRDRARHSAMVSIWTGHGRQILYLPYKYERILAVEEYWDDVRVHAFFADYWSASVPIAVCYVLVIFVLERWMRNRKAFGLRRPLVLWNALLAGFSLVAAIRFGEEFCHTLKEKTLTDSVCYSVDPYSPAAFWACAFALSKVAELVDTLFVVLRKRPLIFLHWYHHAVVLVYSWHSAVELTAAGRWFIFMNYSVHALMYSYYAITSIGFRLPKAVSMLVTTLQTSQMLVGVAISIYVLGLKLSGKVCQQSWDNLALCFAIYASFALLFMRFFHKAYVHKPKSE